MLIYSLILFRCFCHRPCRFSGANASFACFAALTETDEYYIYDIFPVAIPYIKHANSLAIAVVATFRFMPLFSVIL